MNKIFKLPTKSDLKSRTSTISNAFAIAITPYIYPSLNEIEHFLKELHLEQGQCAYCLGKANAMDHVKPLVTGSGYVGRYKNNKWDVDTASDFMQKWNKYENFLET